MPLQDARDNNLEGSNSDNDSEYDDKPPLSPPPTLISTFSSIQVLWVFIIKLYTSIYHIKSYKRA